MSSQEKVKNGWKNINRDIRKYNKKELDIINDQETNPWVKEALRFGRGLTDIRVRKKRK